LFQSPSQSFPKPYACSRLTSSIKVRFKFPLFLYIFRYRWQSDVVRNSKRSAKISQPGTACSHTIYVLTYIRELLKVAGIFWLPLLTQPKFQRAKHLQETAEGLLFDEDDRLPVGCSSTLAPASLSMNRQADRPRFPLFQYCD
jgi:hypothetical protein